MTTVFTSRAMILALFTAAASSEAPAQRTDDNVTAESDDAFGRSVGNERIGIYNSSDVRGFSPVAAGNVRIEGLYFDQQKDPTQRLVETVTIRIGIAAQSYPFPSPTGIVFDKYGWSAVASGVYLYNAPRRFSIYLAADL